MLKKIVLFIAVVLSIISMNCFSLFADEYTAVNLLINGQSISTDQPAVIYNNRTVVPIRVIAEAFECDVDWINDTKTVVISQDGANIYLTVGSNIMTAEMEGQSASMEIDTPPVIINNRTMIPISFISEVLGFKADWDANTKTVNIYREIIDFSGSEYVESYFEAVNRYDACNNAVTDKIADMTYEQLEKYYSIDNKYTEYILNKDIDTYTAEDVKLVNSLADEIESFAGEIGIASYSASYNVNTESKNDVVYYVKPEPFNTDGGFSCIMDKPYDKYSDEIIGMDNDTATYMINTFSMFAEKLQKNTDKMNSTVAEILLEDLNKGLEILNKIEDNPEDYSYPISINGINAEMGALAEGLNIDIGEDLKEYNVTLNNSKYSSQDIVQVRDAFYAALSKHNTYTEVISGYYSVFTSQQLDEYKRITGAKMYYDFNQSNKDSIDYYRGGLILLERSNKRTEIFADKYGINL